MRVKDLGLATYILSSRRCEITGQELDEQGQVWISFRDTELTADLERQFYAGIAQTNVADFLSAQKQLKTLIFSTRRKFYGDDEYRMCRRNY